MGRWFLGLAVLGSGVLQLAAGEFVRLVPAVPGRPQPGGPAAYLAGALLVALGIAIVSGRLARWAALLLAALIAGNLLFRSVPLIVVNPVVDHPWLRGFMYTNPLKQLALIGGALIVLSRLPNEPRLPLLLPRGPRWEAVAAVFLAAFLAVCGFQHFWYRDFVDTIVPSWIPPGQRFWTYFTGAALLAGGVGILVAATARLAPLLSAGMIFLWVFLVHIPRALAGPNRVNEAAGIFEALALSGVALLVAGVRGSRGT
ncbi:MAG TPA: DoxX family membrane protein [Vicinamibacteria bacterium]